MQILVYILEGCWFSKQAEKILSSFKHVKMVKVSYSMKEQYKKKMVPWQTFPCVQIVDNNKKLIVGGLTELQHIIDNQSILKEACNDNNNFKTKLQELEKVININKKLICKFFNALYKPN